MIKNDCKFCDKLPQMVQYHCFRIEYKSRCLQARYPVKVIAKTANRVRMVDENDAESSRLPRSRDGSRYDFIGDGRCL